jgi:hypothetical protein
MEQDVIDLKNPDLYVAGVPHEIFTRLRRGIRFIGIRKVMVQASGASRATTTS